MLYRCKSLHFASLSICFLAEPNLDEISQFSSLPLSGLNLENRKVLNPRFRKNKQMESIDFRVTVRLPFAEIAQISISPCDLTEKRQTFSVWFLIEINFDQKQLWRLICRYRHKRTKMKQRSVKSSS